MRLLLNLLAAAVISLAAGWTASEVAALMPCQGEGLACNINDAIGGYAVLIWSALGPLIFGVILLIAANRVSLAGGMALLLAPLVVFMLGVLVEAWQTFGLEAYKNFRQVLTMFVPPALTVVTQWLVLRYLLGRSKAVPEAAASPEAEAQPEAKPEAQRHEPIRGGGGFAGFPTE